jgi:hypothetical protein
MHAQERVSLMPLGRAFDGFVEHTKRVSPTCLVHFDANRYSVPASFAHRPVSLRVYPDRLVVVAEGQIVCEHARIVERAHDIPRRAVYDWQHYLAVIQRKPGALRSGAPFAEMPKAFRRLQAQMLQRSGGDREMVDVLVLVQQHNEQAVLCAVELALEDGAATKTHSFKFRNSSAEGGTKKTKTPGQLSAKINARWSTSVGVMRNGHSIESQLTPSNQDVFRLTLKQSRYIQSILLISILYVVVKMRYKLLLLS